MKKNLESELVDHIVEDLLFKLCKFQNPIEDHPNVFTCMFYNYTVNRKCEHINSNFFGSCKYYQPVE